MCRREGSLDDDNDDAQQAEYCVQAWTRVRLAMTTMPVVVVVGGDGVAAVGWFVFLQRRNLPVVRTVSLILG